MKKALCLVVILVIVVMGLSQGSPLEATTRIDGQTPTIIPINPKLPQPIEPNPIPLPLDKLETKLMYPLGGETLKKGQPFVIQFQVKNSGTYIIFISKDGGETWNSLNNGTVTADPMGYLPYKLDDPGTYRVKVQKAADSSIYAVGDSFTVAKAAWDGALQATPGGNKIELAWKHLASVKGSVTSYRIYRSTPHPGASSLLTVVQLLTLDDQSGDYYRDKEISYIDKDVSIGQNYFYWVFPVIGGQEYNNAYPIFDMVSAMPKGTIILTVGSPIMIVNGEKREIDPGRGTVPVIVNGRTFLPIRGVVQAMGGSMDWEAGPQVLTIYYNNKVITMQIGSTTAMVDGTPWTMDVAPYIGPTGSTMLPVRYVAEFLGCVVDFEAATHRITITY